jgi:hypothetical protein
MRAKPWELPDGLWQRIEPLLPLRRRRYLRMVDEARSIRDLRSPPANRARLVEPSVSSFQYRWNAGDRRGSSRTLQAKSGVESLCR